MTSVIALVCSDVRPRGISALEPAPALALKATERQRGAIVALRQVQPEAADARDASNEAGMRAQQRARKKAQAQIAGGIRSAHDRDGQESDASACDAWEGDAWEGDAWEGDAHARDGREPQERPAEARPRPGIDIVI